MSTIEKPATGTQAIDRAADLLQRVIDSEHAPTLTELVTATGLAKGTTSRILSALERAGLIQRTGRSGYEPGTVLNNYAIRGGAYAALIARVTPAMEQVAAETGETVTLAVSAPRGLNSVAQVDGTYLLGARAWIGQHVPIHASAGGKVLLALGAAEVPASLEALTTATITDRAALERELRTVCERGYAVIRGELEPGLVAIAVPVLAGGAVVAAMSITGPAERLTVDAEANLAAVMSRTLHNHSLDHDHTLDRLDHEGAA